MGWAVEHFWGIPEQDFQAHEGEVLPPAKRGCLVHNPATPSTRWATAAVLVGFNCQMQFLVAILKPKTSDFHAFQA